jgi:xylulokinase
MSSDVYVIGFDVGTTGAKTCLFRVDGRIELVALAQRTYPLRTFRDGGAEQDPDDWWRALCEGAREVLATAGVPAMRVRAVSFSSQAQGLVLVDGAGTALRPGMTYLDGRGVEQHRRGIKSGVRVAGLRARLLLPSLLITGAVSASVKDPVWKYLWVREREPEVFARARWWLDVKDYLTLRCTGRPVMSDDTAAVTFLFDTRPGHRRWSDHLCGLYGVERAHLPEVVSCADVVGTLRPQAAAELGLTAETEVVAGGIDLSMTALGTGCVEPGQAHVYVGTSGWVSSVVAKRLVDVDHFLGSIMGARPGLYNFVGEQETSGKCIDWAREVLFPDGTIDEATALAARSPAGAGGVLFAPWLHGNRAPFEDPLARGVFFNLAIGTERRHLARAVVEGIALHKRWLLDCMARKTQPTGALRFAGGGAVSDLVAQVMANVTGRTIEAVQSPRAAGALGAAALGALALGAIPGFEKLRESIPVRAVFEPDAAVHDVHERSYEVFKKLHASNRKGFAALQAAGMQEG